MAAPDKCEKCGKDDALYPIKGTDDYICLHCKIKNDKKENNLDIIIKGLRSESYFIYKGGILWRQ